MSERDTASELFALDWTLLNSGSQDMRTASAQKAVRTPVILAIALFEGGFSCLVVDERQPALGNDRGERHELQDLGDDLEDVDERPVGGEAVQEPLRDLFVVVEGPVADPEDEAPSIPAACGGRGTFDSGVPP